MPHGGRAGGSDMVMALAVAPVAWRIATAAAGLNGRGDEAAAEQRALLAAGWEPFAVSGGMIWFRKLT